MIDNYRCDECQGFRSHSPEITMYNCGEELHFCTFDCLIRWLCKNYDKEVKINYETSFGGGLE